MLLEQLVCCRWRSAVMRRGSGHDDSSNAYQVGARWGCGCGYGDNAYSQIRASAR